jgi:poly(3-hydroxyalkanoate) synthetase
VLDQQKAGFASAAIDEEAANIAIALSARQGYLDGRSLAEVFAWLRPTDLVWRYWVNNYIEGKSPTAFDVLFWNADTTRMAAALHRDMITMGLQNSLVTPGAVSMLGTPVDLNQLTTDAYVVAGVADHISPWQACYRSARTLGVKNVRFVLSSSGHIASLSTRPEIRRRPIASPTWTSPIRHSGWSRPTSTRIPGGRTSSPGSANAAARSKPPPRSLAGQAWRRWNPLREATCWNASTVHVMKGSV